MYKNIPRLVIAATQSGAGKTTIVTGIISALVKRNLIVQSYKVGPDYIDPGYHSLASGRPTHNLDTWLIPENRLREIFYNTSNDADIAIIEGVMGLYDGGRNGISSTAQISKILNAPVILVIDVKSMGDSAAAIVLGFREYDKNLNFAGVILNRVGSDNHRMMIEESLANIGIKCFGAIKRDTNLSTPERHLGLLPTSENLSSGLIENIGTAIDSQVDIDDLIVVSKVKSFSRPTIQSVEPNYSKNFSVKIGVAHDEAFNFYYPESLRILESLGAKIVKFSPLNDKKIPYVDGLIIGGGFPEMFAVQLENNISMRESIKNAATSGLPIFAECGGYMYLMNELIDFEGQNYKMVGVIDNVAKMNKKLQMVGYVKSQLMSNCLIGKAGDTLHAHEFHFSNEINDKNNRQNIFQCEKIRNGERYFAGYFSKNIVASYLHIHFAGCISAAINFVENCQEYHDHCKL